MKLHDALTAIAAIATMAYLSSPAFAKSIWDEINETAPRSAWDQLNEAAPRSIFDEIGAAAPVRAPVRKDNVLDGE